MTTNSITSFADFIKNFPEVSDKVVSNPNKRYSFEEYIAFCQKNTDGKFELVDGQIVAMAGGSDKHFNLISNINTELANFLRKSGLQCKCYPGLAVKTGAESYRIPDILIACGDNPNPNYAQNPVIIGEVLSRSTANRDKTTKLKEYKKLPTLKEILLISQKEKNVIVYRRGLSRWSQKTYNSGVIELASIGCFVSVDDIYYDIDF